MKKIDRAKLKLIIEKTELISKLCGGNLIFRSGISTNSSFIDENWQCFNSYDVREREFSGDSFYSLVHPVEIYGFHWAHSGPSAEYLYYKIHFIKNDNINKISVFERSDKSENKDFIETLFEVMYEDHDWPIGGINIYIEEIIKSKFLVDSSLSFNDKNRRVINFSAAQLFNKKCLIINR